MAGIKKYFIRLGDTTTHGGKVISAWGQDGPGPYILYDIPVACIGDYVTCPKCRGTHRIIQGDNVRHRPTLHGRVIASTADYTTCGAQPMASQNSASYTDESWVDPILTKALAAQEKKRVAAAMAASSIAAASGTGQSNHVRESFAEYFVLLDQVTGDSLPDFAWVTRCEGDEQLDITGEDGFTQEAGADGQKSVELLAAIQLKPVIR